ncbi:MAG TPA: hypothetical protein VGY98_01210 [Verrucomicrobiae bacterium]|nr:hypothetical protein [Verrucomicrobiae bacterium]
MKPIKQALSIFLSSPLIWIGATSASVGFLIYWFLWSGYLNPMARVADDLGIGFSLNVLLIPGVILAGICFLICGIILGIVRLWRRHHERTTANQSKIHNL